MKWSSFVESPPMPAFRDCVRFALLFFHALNIFKPILYELLGLNIQQSLATCGTVTGRIWIFLTVVETSFLRWQSLKQHNSRMSKINECLSDYFLILCLSPFSSAQV